MADKPGIKFLRYYTQKLKTFFFSKDILSFSLFLSLSAGFWFVHALGKERETTLTIPVRYVGMPLNVAITNAPPSEIKVTIKDQGLRLLDYPRRHATPLTIDLERKYFQKGEILITPDQLSGRISRYMHMQPTTSVLEVQPDSIQIQYQRLYSKRVPVRLITRIETANQYMLTSKLLPEPKTVTVFGPKSTLDSIQWVPTELIRMSNVNDTVHTTCRLVAHKGVRYSFNRVKVNVFVEPFTERKVQIPVEALNCPAHLSVRTFPAFVTATYTVGLSRFDNYKNSDIQVCLDYNDLKTNKQSKQLLTVKNNTSHISNIRISPQEVEFILEQK